MSKKKKNPKVEVVETRRYTPFEHAWSLLAMWDAWDSSPEDTPFEHAWSLLAMWDAWDSSPEDRWGLSPAAWHG